MARIAHLLDLGVTEYRQACQVQLTCHPARVVNEIGDTLILTEHFPVYTYGRTVRAEHLGTGWEQTSRERAPSCWTPLPNPQTINGVPVYAVDRGGSVTYHGPGQLVGYPILRLRDHCAGPKMYMNRLEEVLIRSLAVLGLSAVRRAGMPGVWIEDRKIGAIGVRISEGVTRHGVALNINNDLTPFKAIVPCGLVGYGVTSVAKETGCDLVVDAKQAVIGAFQDVFELSFLEESWMSRSMPGSGKGPVASRSLNPVMEDRAWRLVI
jgi:lipoate-protein ligase B